MDDGSGSQDQGLDLASYLPRDSLRPFHARSQRWACLVAHRRCGKTVACIADLVCSAQFSKRKNARYAYVAPQYNQAKDIAWSYVRGLTRGLGVQLNESELRADFPGGARLRLYGADNPDRLRGIYLDGVIMDEHADMRESVWGEIIRPLLSDRRGWATFIGTPKGHNGFYRLYQYAVASPEWFTLRLRASQTGILPAAELQDAAKSMTADQYAQEYECSFEAAIVGSYYGRIMNDLDQEGRISEVKHDPNFPVFTAWDLGRTDDTAIWWYQVVAGEVRILECMSSNLEDIEYYARIVNSKPYNYGIHWLPHDARAKTLAAAGRSIQQQLKGHGLKCRIAPQLSVEDGIQASRMTLKRAWFDRAASAEGIEALKTYRRVYDEERKVFREKPMHSWESNYADSFRVLALTWRQAVEAPVQVQVQYPEHRTIDEIIKRHRENRLGL